MGIISDAAIQFCIHPFVCHILKTRPNGTPLFQRVQEYCWSICMRLTRRTAIFWTLWNLQERRR
jgi:hypothetical protein